MLTTLFLKNVARRQHDPSLSWPRGTDLVAFARHSCTFLGSRWLDSAILLPA